MNNLLSYCGLVDVRINGSDKDLPVLTFLITLILKTGLLSKILCFEFLIELKIFVPRLHSKVTATIILTFCLIVTASQFIGDPIDCVVEQIDSGVMDTYCWIHSTFTLPKLILEKTAGNYSQLAYNSQIHDIAILSQLWRIFVKIRLAFF